jgi:hypothetical protein
MSPNRIVALYTPLIFAPLAGGVSVWIAGYFPGVDIPSSRLADVFIAGALIAALMAVQWVHGWQKAEARAAEREDRAAQLATLEAARAVHAPGLAGGFASDHEAEEIEVLLDDDLLPDELDLGPEPEDAYVGNRPSG